MKQYIDKAKIEEILRSLWKKDDGNNSEHRICYNKALQEVQCQLDTIEVEEMDLVGQLNGFQNFYAHENGGEFPSAIEIAKHFFELGLKAQKGE